MCYVTIFPCDQEITTSWHGQWVLSSLIVLDLSVQSQVVPYVVVVLHLPGSAGWLTPLGGAHAVLLRCLHFFLYSSVLLSSSVIFIMKLAAFFSSSTSSWKISLYSIVCPHLSLISGHVWSMCSWVSVSFLQNLHKRSFLHPFCEARRASHCHSPQTTYSSKSTCCVLSAQKSAMHVVVYADRRTIQHSIVDIIDWSWSYWQIWYPSWHVECFWADLSLHTNFRLLHLPLFCNNIRGGL